MHEYFKLALDVIDETTSRVPAEALVRRFDGRWSIAEILEHLTLAFSANAAVFEKALASGQSRARKPVLKQRLVRVLVIELGYFPRAAAPEATRPSGSVPAERVLPAIREALIRLDAVTARIADRFGEDAPVANHPYFAGLSVRQWRKFHWRHTVHHMRQVRARRWNARDTVGLGPASPV